MSYVYTWNPNNCESECDKTCDFGEYLDYENCKCRKKIIDKLVDECAETVEEVKQAKNENSYKYSSCSVYTVLFWIFFTINNGGIGAFFLYCNWSLVKNNVSHITFGTCTQADIY